MLQAQRHFRVLALSATPGNDVTAVQTVIDHLAIAQLELREESSPDVAPYLNARSIDVRVVDLSPEIERIRAPYCAVFERVLGRLCNSRVIFSKVGCTLLFQATIY